MRVGIDLDNARLEIHRLILNVEENFRDSLSLNHPGEDFCVSMKEVCFKDDVEGLNGQNYHTCPFVLSDMPLFRYAGAEPFREDEVIDNLDFDENTNRNEFDRLRETLFYKSFVSRTVEYVSEFSHDQQQYTKLFRSGLVVPVVLHEIPWVFICVGATEPAVFGEDDKQIACTFADAIAELIRLDMVFSAVTDAKKVIVMDDVSDLELYKLLENREEDHGC